MKQLDPNAIWFFFWTTFGKLLLTLFWLLLAIGFFLVLPINEYFGDGGLVVYLLTFPLIALAILAMTAWIFAKLTYKYYRYELREDGFRKEHGIIWKKYVTIPYDRIQNVDIYRGVIARILGLSDLQIQTAGGITMAASGAFSEGRLPALSSAEAEKIRDEVVKRARHHRSGQGL